TLTPVQPDGQQESSSMSSFVTSMLNPISDADVESIFTTASSPIAPIQTFTPIMTPSTIATITTSNEAPIPPTTILSATNQFVEAVSKIPADLTEMKLKKILIEKMEGNKRDGDDNDQEGPSVGSDWGSKRRREGREPEFASTPSEQATRSASRSTTGTQSRQMSASESAFAEEPMQTTCQMDEPPHPVFETGAEDHPIVQTSQHPEWFSQPRKPPTPNQSALDVYSKRRIIAVTDLKIVEWHKYKHLGWISRRMEDLQLGVESYQKRLNLTKPDTYRSDLKRREAYTAYSNPRGFIYQNKDKKNRLMRIDELYKFSDGTLNDVRNALDDHLKGIRMQYLPQAIWRKGDKDRAVAMIQSIDKMLNTRRIMRSLKRFVRG
nr:hypothetical protein [Tanacetum cinerariifolium]